MIASFLLLVKSLWNLWKICFNYFAKGVFFIPNMWCVARFGTKHLKTAFEWLTKALFWLVRMCLNGLFRKAFLWIRLHDIQTPTWYLTIRMVYKRRYNDMANGISGKNSNSYSKCVLKKLLHKFLGIESWRWN